MGINPLHLKLKYKCEPGCSLALVEMRDEGINIAHHMDQAEDGAWSVTIVPQPESNYFCYFYILLSEGFKSLNRDSQADISAYILRREENTSHTIKLAEINSSTTIFDYWQFQSKYLPFYSSLFTHYLFRRKRGCDQPTEKEQCDEHIKFTLLAPTVEPSQQIVITGNSPKLGKWVSEQAIALHCHKMPLWEVTLPKSWFDEPCEYKFAVRDTETEKIIKYEVGENRFISLSNTTTGNIIVSAYEPNFGISEAKFAGCAIPLFSLRTNRNHGIGDLSSLKLFIDWAKQCGQRVIQLLPINDTTMTHTWRDSYPYNANSIYAIHPLYIDLNRLAPIENSEMKATLDREGVTLNSLAEIDYDRVDKLKWRYLRIVFAESGYKTLSCNRFIEWFKRNMRWVESYAFYAAMREYFSTSDFTKWGMFSTFNVSKLRSKALEDEKFNNEVMLHVFIQYQLHIQFSEVRSYAASKGVVLKGDIPIGISRNSVDMWVSPELFNANEQAGAPPDEFATDGQNWGFATYNWDKMAEDGYLWWVNRFRKMSEYFGAYRIDHLLGFFRIWQVPISAKSGLLGSFSPALPLSKTEIERFGFEFDEKYTHPLIDELSISQVFGELAEKAANKFFELQTDGQYSFKEPYNTQRKIEHSDAGVLLSDNLIALHNEVLFICDSKEPHKYHPRINGQKSLYYARLNDAQKAAFDALYNDFFYIRHNAFWKDNALKKLPELIDSTTMLACVEDLGMIPQSVPEVINELELLSLEIERMPKSGTLFADPGTYPYYSVATTSSHDMSPMRLWWKNEQPLRQWYYNEVLHYEGEAPEELSTELAETILNRTLFSNAMLSIIPFQDWVAVDNNVRRKKYDREQINIPSDPNNYWRYRMHISIERLLDSDSLTEKIKEMIAASGRDH